MPDEPVYGEHTHHPTYGMLDDAFASFMREPHEEIAVTVAALVTALDQMKASLRDVIVSSERRSRRQMTPEQRQSAGKPMSWYWYGAPLDDDGELL